MRPRHAVPLTRNPTKDFYPERPSGVKDLSFNSRVNFSPPLSIFFTRKRGPLCFLNNSKLLRMNPYKEPAARAPLAPFWFNLTPFRINTYSNVRKCCKQRTYALAKPFTCNTYEKAGGVGDSVH